VSAIQTKTFHANSDASYAQIDFESVQDVLVTDHEDGVIQYE
jgi:hypothetical protein